MKFYSNYGKTVDEPFRKFEVRARLGRNHAYYLWMPVIDGVPLAENEEGMMVPQDDTFRVVKSKKSGRFLIVSAQRETADILDILAFITDEAGFRGSTGLIKNDTTAQVLYTDSTHAACSGYVTVIAVIRPAEQVVTYSRGRRNNDVTVWRNSRGELEKTTYTKSEYALIAAAAGAEDEYEEL